MRLTPSSRLTPVQVREIRLMYATGEYSQDKLARHFGVSQTTINSIVLNKTYTEEVQKDE